MVKIDKDLVTWLIGSTGITTIADVVVKGGMDWQAPALGFCINGVLSLLKARTDRKNFSPKKRFYLLG